MVGESAPTKIVIGTQIPEMTGVPVLVAYGDPDDHLRWTVLLAHALGKSVPGVQAREAVETCLKRDKVSWSQRLDAFSYLLERTPSLERDRPRALLVDLDALDPGPLPPEALWDDRDFRRQREIGRAHV